MKAVVIHWQLIKASLPPDVRHRYSAVDSAYRCRTSGGRALKLHCHRAFQTDAHSRGPDFSPIPFMYMTLFEKTLALFVLLLAVDFYFFSHKDLKSRAPASAPQSAPSEFSRAHVPTP